MTHSFLLQTLRRALFALTIAPICLFISHRALNSSASLPLLLRGNILQPAKYRRLDYRVDSVIIMGTYDRKNIKWAKWTSEKQPAISMTLSKYGPVVYRSTLYSIAHSVKETDHPVVGDTVILHPDAQNLDAQPIVALVRYTSTDHPIGIHA